MCYKACEHMCNVLGKYVIQFSIYGLRVKWARPGSKYTWGTGSNRVKPQFFSNQNMPVLEPEAVKTNLILPGSKRCTPSCQKWSNSIILLLINIKPCLSQLRNNQLLPLQIKLMILLQHLQIRFLLEFDIHGLEHWNFRELLFSKVFHHLMAVFS